MLLRKPKQSPAAPPPVIDVRPLCTVKDLDAILAIEKATHSDPWTRRQTRRILSSLNVHAYVCTINGDVGAYAIALIDSRRVGVLNLTVAAQYRRMGLGRRLVGTLKMWLGGGRDTIRVDVAESNLPGQLFLRSCGFICDHTVEGVFENDESAYCFSFRLGW